MAPSLCHPHVVPPGQPAAACQGGRRCSRARTSIHTHTHVYTNSLTRRTTESFRLENISQIPNPSHAHRPHPTVPHPRGSGTPPGRDSPHPVAAVPLLTALSKGKLFLTSNLKYIHPHPALALRSQWSPSATRGAEQLRSPLTAPQLLGTAVLPEGRHRQRMRISRQRRGAAPASRCREMHLQGNAFARHELFASIR